MSIFLTDKLEGWLNVPAVLNSPNLAPPGELQYGVRVFDIRDFSSIIQTRKRGIPMQWLVDESNRHFSGYGTAFLDNEYQEERRYNHLPSDSITPHFWFVNVDGGGSQPIKLLTAQVSRKGDKIYGVAADDNHLPGLFGPKLLLYTIKRK